MSLSQGYYAGENDYLPIDDDDSNGGKSVEPYSQEEAESGTQIDGEVDLIADNFTQVEDDSNLGGSIRLAST